MAYTLKVVAKACLHPCSFQVKKSLFVFVPKKCMIYENSAVNIYFCYRDYLMKSCCKFCNCVQKKTKNDAVLLIIFFSLSFTAKKIYPIFNSCTKLLNDFNLIQSPHRLELFK